MLNHLRGQRRCRESPGLPTSSKERPRSSQDLERAAIRRALRDRLLAVIGPELHDVVEAVFLHDLTHQEAATLLGLSDGSLKARVAKAKRELSEQASLILPPSQRSAS
ncbi:MAG: sigma factor-like helix-turn-helix DNA-binding protein [Minicystis sp.]